MRQQLMDVHRAYAYVLESLGDYKQAIEEYDKALAHSRPT
jgi:tetratricopeptide (TPR) repeat protein